VRYPTRWPLALTILGLAVSWPAEAASTRVDVALVLAVDMSDSMSVFEQSLQRRGYREALVHPEVVEAIRAGPRGRIALTYVEWGAPGRARIVVPWTLIDGPLSAAAFADNLAATPVPRLEGTSISAALAFSAGLLQRVGGTADRRVVDISGDGPNNLGGPVALERDRLVRRGITVNGLPIAIQRGAYQIPDIVAYYRDCVVGGAGSFSVPVTGTASFTAAIRRKLTLEISGLAPLAQFAALPAAPADCMIGERFGGRE
jgi:hypothetical protein